jgi:PadR family transcriptional regulator, regulatory protein PadR
LPITKSDKNIALDHRLHRDLYSGFIRLHVLHHAVKEPPVFGLALIQELSRHGYRMSPGTMYPILHGLEERGLLRSREVWANGHKRREYRATAQGRKALEAAKAQLHELFGELLEDAPSGLATARESMR